MQVPPGSRYARLVRVVLAAVLHPGHGLTPDQIDDVRRSALELLRTAGGDAEPLGDGIAAVFDDPRTGLEAASRLHRAMADGSKRHAWCIGLHVCDLVLSSEIAACLSVVERAEALSRLAHPGTTAVAAGELSAFGTLRGVDARPLEATLPGDPTARVLLLAPGPTPDHARRQLFLVAGTAALGGAAVVTWLVTRPRPHVAVEGLTLGVGPF